MDSKRADKVIEDLADMTGVDLNSQDDGKAGELERWDMYAHGGQMEPWEGGDWVRYEDADRLRTENARQGEALKLERYKHNKLAEHHATLVANHIASEERIAELEGELERRDIWRQYLDLNYPHAVHQADTSPIVMSKQREIDSRLSRQALSPNKQDSPPANTKGGEG